MNPDFVLCTRAVRGGAFVAEPGRSAYLCVPPGEAPKPDHSVRRGEWIKRLWAAAVWGKDARTGGERGDILVFIHGYNNSQETAMARHRRLEKDLSAAGFKGVVLSYDWPSAEMALNYLEDRHDAKRTALQLVTDAVSLLAERQTPDCTVNVHVLAHSTGAYVIREACDDADDAKLANNGWMVSQIVLIGADVSSASLSEGNAKSGSLYRHCVRLTNYSNRMDTVLKLSNAKRLGMAPRAGRAGLPGDAPAKAVDVDCTSYFAKLASDAHVRERDQWAEIGAFDHSWHIGNVIFAKDLFETLRGDLDRAVIPTRRSGPDGKLYLLEA